MESEKIRAITFNMASMESIDDMMQPLDSVRNLKVNDSFPIIFLDKFDSNPKTIAHLKLVDTNLPH